MDINEFGLEQEYFGFENGKYSESNFSNFSFENTDEYKAALNKHEANKKAIRDKFFPRIDALPNVPESDMQRNLIYAEMETEFGREKNRFEQELKDLRRRLGLSAAQSGLQAIAGVFENLGIKPRPAPSVVQTSTNTSKGGGNQSNRNLRPLVIGGVVVGLLLVGVLVYKIAK
jgi:hypothetical protein